MSAGIMLSDPTMHDGIKLVRLWVHECERTFADRMTTEDDKTVYYEMANGICRQFFGELVDLEQVFEAPNLYAPFYTSPAGDDCCYDQVLVLAFIGLEVLTPWDRLCVSRDNPAIVHGTA